MFLNRLSSSGVVIAFVQAQMLGLFLARLRSLDHDCFDGSLQQFRIVDVGSGNGHAQRSALLIDEQAAFGAVFSAIRGVRTDTIPPKRAFAMAPSALCQSQ